MDIDFKPTSSYTTSRNDYTQGQLMVLDKSVQWAKGNYGIWATIKGFAGTGKTTVARDIIHNLTGTIAVSAPTHKAARVAASAMGADVFTIQKLLGLRPNVNLENYDVNNPQFDPIAPATLKDFKYLFVDEGSMVNRYLKKLILDEAAKYKTKVIFIGDPYQLPPINEKQSQVFTGDYIFELNEIVRQNSDNKLIELLTMARDAVRTNSSSLVALLSRHSSKYDSDTDAGYVITNGEHFATLLADRFASTEFQHDIDYCRYAAFTNKSVLDVNNYIRKVAVGDHDQILVQDDVLTSYSTILDEFNSPIIINSEDYIVEEILDYNNKYIIQGFLTTFRAVSNGKVTSRLFIVDHTNQDSLIRYVSIFNSLLSKAQNSKGGYRRQAWDEFYAFRNYNLLMSDLYTESGKLITSKDIDYAFGLTVHKTQGSTFSNIFVNVNDIIYNKYGVPYSNIGLRNRLLYVAFSRARNSAFILT